MSKTPTKKVNVHIQPRDLQVLAFLWKWKLVSTAALTSKRIFPKVSLVTAYNRLNELRRCGYIALRSQESGERFAWTLTKKGFYAIRDHLPDLKEEGYGSEHFYHDFLVTAFHLGGWLVDRPESVSFVSEQDLRRYAPEKLPRWVPETSLHRPDGYWGFKHASDTHFVAIEVEVTRKHLSSYDTVSYYYADFKNLAHVFWMTESLKSATKIHKRLAKDAASETRHSFILEKEFLKLGWAAPFVCGPLKGKTVWSVLLRLAGRKEGEAEAMSPHRLLLEPRKCYVRSELWPKPSPHLISPLRQVLHT